MSEEIRVDEWVGITKSAVRYAPFWESVRKARDLGDPVTHVAMAGQYVMQASTDLELVKLFAEHQYSDQDQVGEFKWERDEHHSSTLHLKYKHTQTGEWESTINSITTVPALPEVRKP